MKQRCPFEGLRALLLASPNRSPQLDIQARYLPSAYQGRAPGSVPIPGNMASILNTCHRSSSCHIRIGPVCSILYLFCQILISACEFEPSILQKLSLTRYQPRLPGRSTLTSGFHLPDAVELWKRGRCLQSFIHLFVLA